MEDVILDLLPLIVGAAVVPFYLIVVLFLLLGRDGLSKALAFVAGGIAVRLMQGLLFGLVWARPVRAGLCRQANGKRSLPSTRLAEQR